MNIEPLNFEKYTAEYCTLFEQIRLYSAENSNLYYWLTTLCRVDTISSSDITRCQPQISVEKEGADCCVLRIRSDSTVWEEKDSYFLFSPDGVEYFIRVRGKGLVSRLYFLTGLLNQSVFGSIPGFDSFIPGCPNFLGRGEFGPNEYFSINVAKETTHWGLALNSGPLFYLFHRHTSENCIWAGILAEKKMNSFNSFDFNHKPIEVQETYDNVLNTQSFSLDYAGHLEVNGTWESPHLYIGFAPDDKEALTRYIALLHQRNAVAKGNPKIHSWWRKPIFCGWHEQLAITRKSQLEHEDSFDALEGGEGIMNQCTQNNHEHWMNIIEQQRLPIGTIIIDAKWQKTFGGFEVDEEKWPDMCGFIKACHNRDIHVILWIKAWDPQGLDNDECIIHKGKRVSPDPTSDKYRKRLREGLHYILSSQNGHLNADGLKIDGTNCMPVGQDIITRGNIYGYELQYEYLRFIYENAKQVKSDALISLYTANPYFQDVCDMVRLGDLYSLYGRPVDTLKQRANTVNIAMAGKPIDTDGNFRFSIAMDFVHELAEQVKIGIPTIYQVELLFQHRNFSKPALRKLTEENYRKIREILIEYVDKLEQK